MQEQNNEEFSQRKAFFESRAKEQAAKVALEERRQKIKEDKIRIREEKKYREREDLQKETEQNMDMQQKKCFFESLAKEQVAKAALEEQRLKKKEQNGPKKQATPLVLPSNCNWDATTGIYEQQPDEKRESLKVVEHAIDQLCQIKGPVCVVAIAGPYRKGKSYALSKAFDQGEVFPLGHEMTAQTMGIWLWIVPEKFRDSTGQEFTVVLLDSEGTDSPSGSDDNKIFTLAVLLSSILIYNSVAVAGKSDLENLQFITKLSERIQLRSTRTDGPNDDDFHLAFPYFIWLLRDKTLRLPKECQNIKEYFTKIVFTNPANTEESTKAAESILKFFAGFDAFALPSPSVNPEVITNLYQMENRANPEFLKQFSLLRTLLHTKLSPKKSINKGEFVNGEGLAALVEMFVEALNTPGTVPNVQNAWDKFVHEKCSKVVADALETYTHAMNRNQYILKMMPCNSDVLQTAHDKAMETCYEMFQEETSSFASESVERHFKEMMEKTDFLLSELLKTNEQKTKASCSQLVKDLEKKILDPVLSELHGPDGSKMDFNKITEAYNLIERRYKKEGRGDQATKENILLDVHLRLSHEMTRNKNTLKNLKNYNAKLAMVKTQNAVLEKKKEEAEREKKRLNKEKDAKQKEMDFFRSKHEEETKRLKQTFEKDLKVQKEQLKNMMEAKFEEQRKNREAAFQRQKETLDDTAASLKTKIDEKANEVESLEKKITETAKETEKKIKKMKEDFENERESANNALYHDYVKKLAEETKKTQKKTEAELSKKIGKASKLQRAKYGFTGNPKYLLD